MYSKLLNIMHTCVNVQKYELPLNSLLLLLHIFSENETASRNVWLINVIDCCRCIASSDDCVEIQRTNRHA
jgi:hypothetical protein